MELDIRKIRVYQEAFDEGYAEGFEEGYLEVLSGFVGRTTELKRPIAEIAEFTGLTRAQIKKMRKAEPGRAKIKSA